MNSIKCPQCGLVNWGAPPNCKRCQLSFQDIPAQAFVSVAAGEQINAPGFPQGAALAEETERTRKAWKWFVAYCVLMALLYLLTTGIGVLLVILDLGVGSFGNNRGEMLTQGVIFLIFGLVLLVPFSIGPFIKGKSWGWVYGIILIALGMTSCCLWPLTIPLMIQWVKPEMKRMFGHT